MRHASCTGSVITRQATSSALYIRVSSLQYQSDSSLVMRCFLVASHSEAALAEPMCLSFDGGDALRYRSIDLCVSAAMSVRDDFAVTSFHCGEPRKLSPA